VTATWPTLTEHAPALRRYGVEAIEAATNGWYGWPLWLKTDGAFRGVVHTAAKQAGVSFGSALDACLTHLQHMHRQARQAAGHPPGVHPYYFWLQETAARSRIF